MLKIIIIGFAFRLQTRFAQPIEYLPPFYLGLQNRLLPKYDLLAFDELGVTDLLHTKANGKGTVLR